MWKKLNTLEPGERIEVARLLRSRILAESQLLGVRESISTVHPLAALEEGLFMSCLYEGRWRELDSWMQDSWLSVVVKTMWFQVLPEFFGISGPEPKHMDVVRLDLDPDINSVSAFYLCLGESINGPGGYFGAGLDGLQDCLGGGFGTDHDFDLVLSPRSQVEKACGPLATWSHRQLCVLNRVVLAEFSPDVEEGESGQLGISRGRVFGLEESTLGTLGSPSLLESLEKLFSDMGRVLVVED